jgi:redox-sensitive bicupin YhaK (pirin superfamily)
MSAGTGILHSEKNDSWRLTGDTEHRDPVHFVQMWVPPDGARLEPGYEQLEIADADLRGRLAVVASGMERDRDRAAIAIRQRYAALHAARLDAGDTVQLPSAPFVHLYVARGTVDLEGSGRLETGDAARITAADGQRVSAVDGPAEILTWEMHATVS